MMRVVYLARLPSSHSLRNFPQEARIRKECPMSNARAWYSNAGKGRAKSVDQMRAWTYKEKQMRKIERENEIWRLRAATGDFPLPPAMPVECRKGKGQHLLKNTHIADAIVQKAGVRNTDTVLEIGPGTGNLTLKLLAVARKVVAVEVDPRMVDELQRRVQLTSYAHKLEVIRGDIMKVELPEFDLCVANIPYKISSPLTFKLLSCASRYRAAVIMLQREFARRLMAHAGDPRYGRLSVNTQLLATVSILMEVSKANFSPPPKVDSTVICITPNPWPPLVDLQEWNSFIRVCFSRKNKTLGAIFRQKHILSLLAGYPSQTLSDVDEDSCEETEDSDCNGEVFHAESEPGNCEVLNQEDFVELKEKAINVLASKGFENRRSVKLAQSDFLKLLASFNEAGINFRNVGTAQKRVLTSR